MTAQPVFVKRAFITGLLAGLAMGAYLLIEGALGLHSEYIHIGQYTGYLRYLLLLLAIILTMRFARDTLGESGMPFGRAVGVGIIVTLGAALVMGAAEFLYTSVIFPDFFDTYLALQIENMRAAGTPEAEIAEMKEMAKQWSTPGMNFLLYFIETSVIGAVLSLISAPMMKREAVKHEANAPTSSL